MHRIFKPLLIAPMATSVIIAAIFATLVGCASAPEPPTASLAKAASTIDDAERAGARQYAGADLDEAKARFAQAEGALESEKMTEAGQFAEQAGVAADLAMARTEAAKASEINRQLHQDADALDTEMKRKGDQR